MSHVWRDADVDPAEPTDVSDGSTTTRSTSSSVRAICSITVTSPCPTSAAAVWTSATGPSGVGTSRTRAVE